MGLTLEEEDLSGGGVGKVRGDGGASVVGTEGERPDLNVWKIGSTLGLSMISISVHFWAKMFFSHIYKLRFLPAITTLNWKSGNSSIAEIAKHRQKKAASTRTSPTTKKSIFYNPRQIFHKLKCLTKSEWRSDDFLLSPSSFMQGASPISCQEQTRHGSRAFTPFTHSPSIELCRYQG